MSASPIPTPSNHTEKRFDQQKWLNRDNDSQSEFAKISEWYDCLMNIIANHDGECNIQ